MQDYDCTMKLINTKHLLTRFIHETCVPKCPLECDFVEYKASTATHKFHGDIYVDYIQSHPNLSRDFVSKPINVDTVSQSIVAVNVFYDSLSYEYSTESPQMSVFNLLANIGGNLGLFLGVSLFSMCELFELLVRICCIKMGQRQSR